MSKIVSWSDGKLVEEMEADADAAADIPDVDDEDEDEEDGEEEEGDEEGDDDEVCVALRSRV